jgi:hypothetical protein
MMKSSKEDAAERALAAILDVLASILVPLDVTPARLAQIARASFVKACAVDARMRSSGRPHLARIATRTGLSRAEVKRVVAAKYSFGPREPETLPRSLRVLSAWQSSAGYSNAGRGLSLRLTGPYPSFQTLCRDFSGDIPYKVILTELERLNRVKRKRTKISIVTLKARTKSQRDLTNLVFAASLLNDLCQSNKVLVRRKEKVSASVSIQDSYVENAIASRVTALLDNLPELFVSRTKPGTNSNRVTIYTVVSKCKRSKKLRS